MNTATLKHYIEFASDSGFPYMLIDAGWALSTPGAKPGDYADPADITRYNPTVDIPELLRYAKEKTCSHLALVALDLGRQIHGPGLSAV